jgi:hypothetical protein
LWVLPPEGSRFGSLARDIFAAKGLPSPRAAVIAYGLEMTVNLLGTGRYFAIHPESVLNFPSKHPFIRKLPIELPIVSGPIGILTLKNRALNATFRIGPHSDQNVKEEGLTLLCHKFRFVTQWY